MASPKGLISLFLLVVTRISLVDASVPVTVGLRTSWPAHNLLLEILETAAIEQPSSFFPLVDLLTSPDAFPPTSSSFNGDAGSGGLAPLTPEAIHEASLAILRQQGYIATLTPSEVKTESSKHINLKEFELALSLHVASPKLQAFYSFYEDWVLSKMEGVRGSTVDSEECLSWVDWYGARLCSSDDLKAVLSREALDAADKTAPPKKPKLLPFDHIYPDPGTTIFSPSRTAILYADITSSNFRDLHEALLKHATSLPPKLQYVFRYVTPPKLSNGVETKKQFLTGYGVGLDLKKTDYLVVDDRRAARSDSDVKDVIAEEESDNGPELVRLLLDALPPSQSGEPVNLTAPLNKEEYKYLGVQATQLILNSENPIDTLVEISENFPLYATEIARKVEIQGDLQYEMAVNARRVPRSVTMGWLNGKAMDNINDLNAFSILNMLRAERPHMQALTSLGLDSAQALQVLTGEAVAESFNQGSMFDGIFDASDRQEGGEVIMWLNDIEKDERYSKWPKNIDQILMPIYPGSFHSIRINLWNIVLGVDLSNRESLIWIFKHVSNIIERKFPFRWGIAPLTDTPEAEKAARIFYYVQKHYGPKETMDFIRSLIAAQQEGDTIDFLVANAFFNNLGINVKPLLELELDSSVSHDYDVVVEGQEPHAIEKLENAKKWAERLDVKIPKNELGHVFLNGRHYPLDSNFLMSLQRDAGSQTSYIQNELQTGKLSSGPEVDWSTYFYDLPSTPKRRNRYLFPDPETSPLQVKRLDVLFRNAGYEYPYRDLLNPVETDPPTPLLVTLWIVGDLDAPETMDMAIGAIKALEKHKDFRLGFIHASKILPMSDATSAPHHSALLQQLSGHFGGLSPSQLLEALETSTPGRVNPLEYLDFCMSGQILAREIGLRPGQMGVIVNGRIIGPLPAGAFSEVDFPPLIVYERDRRVTPIITALKEAQFATESLDRSSYADLISTAASVIAAVQVPDPTAEGLFNIPMRPRQRQYRHLDSKHSKIAHGKEDTALFHFAFVVDPLSEAAQKLGGLLKWLSTLETVYLEVYMIADQTREELPLKRFYRSLVRPHLIFNEAGDEVPPMVGFKNLPEEPIYTLAMDVPASWLARPRESEYDLDNIHLASLSGSERITGVKALFDLDFLVIEGHARDTSTGSPPRGLQLQLISHDMTPIADTLVVENLGYLQFKAKPGVFQLDIKKGRGEDVFVTESVGNAGWESPPVESEAGAEVTLTSFEGLTLYPRFKRQQGQADTDVLRPPRENFFSSAVQKVVQAVTSWIRPPEVIEEADINIFTVASGHLYERFASIMILSVMKNTNSTVKFWFIENFLSPSFLEFIPHLAEEYNFQYELVTYKWPSWLRSQREKQRVIWGYKILFLDVLFPMDLKKVIFVDADQIVRTDLQELVDLDLHGAPYGYTPMGDDNADMEGFRFWKTGYWKDYLKGRPYHISALYVIDLVKFRQLAAGDRLRGHYQQLSADPNSLANLDQDLPNNMQFEVPIFSLDKNWLWCETWCSKDRLDQAKTIDLCQNPLTKEPKLSRARQIPEWSKYDGEIAGFARRLVKEGKIGSSALSAEVDALAGEKPKKGTGTTDDSAAPVEGETTASSSPVHAEL